MRSFGAKLSLAVLIVARFASALPAALETLADDAAALEWTGNPVDTRAPLARAGVALIHVVGDIDDVVPPAENALMVAERYRQLGGTIELIHKPGVGHHPHGLDEPAPEVGFLIRHAGGAGDGSPGPRDSAP